MPRSLLLASTVSLGLLSGFIFILVVIFSIFVGDMGGGLIGAITTTIVINFLLWLVSPWCSDWMYRFFYKNQWTTLEELAVESPKTAEIIRKICEAEKIKLPKIGIIPDDNPNAFTYGSGPWNARIIITHGIIRFLSDEERSSVVAHELGHIANRDFIIMTIASTLLQILYEIYYYTNKQKKGNSDSRSKLAIVGLIALIFYWLGSYILLYLSRVREYAADAFSAKYTDANLLADALIKIAMGILSTPGDARLVKSTRYIGVAGDAVSKQLGLVYKNCEKSGSFELLGRSLLFDLKSPWAFLAELSSTHPLSGKRIGALMKQTLAPKYDLASIEAKLQIDTNRLYRGFARDLTLVIIARLAPWILGLITLIALLALHIPIEGGFLFVVTGFLVGIVVSMLIKLSMMYPANQDEPTTILEAMGDIYASPVRGRKISLEGQLVGRGIPGYIFSEDMLMQDKTGLIYVDYESRFGWIGNLFYSLKKAAENIGKDVRTSGWFFRDMSSRIVADRITGEGIDLKGGVRLWMLIGIMLMTVVSGVVGVMAGSVYEESKGLTVEQTYVYPVPQGGTIEEMEQTLDEKNNQNIETVENTGSGGNKNDSSTGEQIHTNNITIELSAKATEGKTIQISSNVETLDATNNAGNYITIKSNMRDALRLTVNDKLYLIALRYNNAPIKITPMSTANYLVLQEAGMLGLSYDQIRTQINHIESHSDYKQLVEYIDYKVNSSYSDPINTELDFALIKLIRGIKNELKYEKTINPIENANESINTVATNSCNITLSEGEEISDLLNIKLSTLGVSNDLDLEDLCSREQLALINLGLENVPEGIIKLKHLKKLALYDNKITNIPEGIGKLTELQELYIRNNQIQTLPKSIGQLGNLKLIDISNNQITEFPEEFGNLINLEGMDASNNKLNQLPESFTKLQKLTGVLFGGNNLGELNYDFNNGVFSGWSTVVKTQKNITKNGKSISIKAIGNETPLIITQQ